MYLLKSKMRFKHGVVYVTNEKKLKLLKFKFILSDFSKNQVMDRMQKSNEIFTVLSWLRVKFICLLVF